MQTLFLAVLLAGVLPARGELAAARAGRAAARARPLSGCCRPLLTAPVSGGLRGGRHVNWELIAIMLVYAAAAGSLRLVRAGLCRHRAALVAARISGRGGASGRQTRAGLSAQRGVWNRDPAGAVLFLGFRRLDGMKYRLPGSPRDRRNTLVGFRRDRARAGRWSASPIGFIPMPHAAHRRRRRRWLRRR